MLFKDLLKKHREQSNLTIAQLARAIKKTEGYLRKVEKYDYTPSTYAVSCELANIFKLNKKDRREFMQQAYRERTQSEAPFLKEFSVRTITQSKSTEPTSLEDGPNQYKFFISWTTFENQALITPVLATELQRFMQDILNKAKSICHHIQIFSNRIIVILEPVPTLHMDEFIVGLKSISAGLINDRIPNTHTPIWDSQYRLHTLGALPDLFQTQPNESLINEVIHTPFSG